MLAALDEPLWYILRPAMRRGARAVNRVAREAMVVMRRAESEGRGESSWDDLKLLGGA